MAVSLRSRHRPLWLIAIIVGVVVLFLPDISSNYTMIQQVQLALILSLLVSGLNLSLGYAGELALGQAAAYAAGAYAAGILSSKGHTDLLLQLLVGGVAALVVGTVTGIPGLRLGSWSLAMTSFFLVLLIPDVISIFSSQTGGHNGLSGILPATFFGSPLSSDGLYTAIVVVTAVWFAVMRNIAVSRHGTALRVLKQSPVLASSMGISVFRMKLLAYALGALPAGLAGALFANLMLYVSPDSFSFTLATTVLAASILGGSATVYGALVGGFILQFGLNATSSFEQYSLLVTGGFLIVGGVLLTGGLIGLARDVWSRWGIRLAGSEAKRSQLTPEMPDLDGVRLEVQGVTKAFGGNRALAGVDLVAEPGRVTALIGPNGSGKTTLLNMICGFYRTDAGAIRLGSREVQGRAPYRVARAGVARTFQTPNIPAGITVLEAVTAGRYTTQRATVLEAVLRLPRYRRVRRADYLEARRMLSLVGIEDLADTEATALPLGQRRLLEVARSLVARPGVLLLDEVASGLDEDEVLRLAEVIRRVRAAGGTVVLVEHNFQLVLSLADEIYALAHGQLMAHGTPEEIENDPRVMSEYLGIDQDRPQGGGMVLGDLVGEAAGGGTGSGEEA
ncbi:MAG: branched-chain amino acid ABC transporter ATP-binding protein/permease [Nocardioides sp.]|uniref:branched-chain amino acid ABC transporter ATP-binding protein/permease n=1 Tax=Nocardioides sp. TaxID=35761 RepID=UPI0039E372D1